jgi:hypothetical protein
MKVRVLISSIWSPFHQGEGVRGWVASISTNSEAFAPTSPSLRNASTLLKKPSAHRTQINHQLATHIMPSQNEPALIRVLPDREPRTRRPPHIHHFGIRSRLRRNPLEEIQNQRRQRIAHSISTPLYSFLDRGQQRSQIERSIMPHAIDEERRRAVHPAPHSAAEVSAHALGVSVRLHLFDESR